MTDFVKWFDVRTFDDLCVKGAQYINGEINDFPGCPLMSESLLIKDYLYKINQLGFFTKISQPSLKTEPILSDWLKANFNNNYQRAFVGGFMERGRAEKLYELLRYDSNIEIFCSNRENHIDNSILTIVDYPTRLVNAQSIFSNYSDGDGDGYGVNYFKKVLGELVIDGVFSYISDPVDFESYNGLYRGYLSQEVISLLNNSLVGVEVVDRIYNRQEDYLWNQLIDCLNIC